MFTIQTIQRYTIVLCTAVMNCCSVMIFDRGEPKRIFQRLSTLATCSSQCALLTPPPPPPPPHTHTPYIQTHISVLCITISIWIYGFLTHTSSPPPPPHPRLIALLWYPQINVILTGSYVLTFVSRSLALQFTLYCTAYLSLSALHIYAFLPCIFIPFCTAYLWTIKM